MFVKPASLESCLLFYPPNIPPGCLFSALKNLGDNEMALTVPSPNPSRNWRVVQKKTVLPEVLEHQELSKNVFRLNNVEAFWKDYGILWSWATADSFVVKVILNLFFFFRSNTPKKAVMAGSMQLLAGVKLCTGRVITNHPHYEDKSLRERTKQVRGLRIASSFLGSDCASSEAWRKGSSVGHLPFLISRT